MKLSEIEELVLKTIRLEAPTPFLMKQRVHLIAREYGWQIPSETEIQNTIESLYQRGIIQIIDAHFIEQMQSELNRKNIHGPVFDWPEVGSFELTSAGYDCIKEKLQQAREKSSRYTFDVTSTPVEEHFQYFALSRQLLDAVKMKFESDPWLTVPGEPERCGAWQLSLQETQLSGFKLDVIESTESCEYAAFQLPSIVEFIRSIQAHFLLSHKVMKQKYGVENAAEVICLVLCSGQFGQRGIMYQSAQIEQLTEYYPVKLSLDAKEIFRRVLERGWLSVTTSELYNAYDQAKSDSKYCINLMEKPTLGKTTCLTPYGFSILFEMLSLLWGNDQWKTYLIGKRPVRTLRYHYYDDYEKAVQAIDLLPQKTDNVLAGPIEELGRWCTHWYEVSEQGYRVPQWTQYE